MVAATSKEYSIQFNPYLGAGNDEINPELGLGGSVVNKLVAVFPKYYALYHNIKNNFFTSLPLLRHLKQNNIYSTEIILLEPPRKCFTKTHKSHEKNEPIHT